MAVIKNKAFRHPLIGRIFPGRGFTLGDISYPPNWLELASDEEIRRVGFEVSDDAAITVQDGFQEEAYQRKIARRDEAVREQFETLGRYVQAFALMIDAVRGSCILMTTTSGKQQKLMNTIFHHGAMSDRALMEIFRAMVIEVLSDEEEEAKKLGKPSDGSAEIFKDILKDLHQRYADRIDWRNKVVHGTWHIGWFSQDDDEFTEIWMHKGDFETRKLEFIQRVKSVSDLASEIEKCREIEDMVRRFFGCFSWRQEIDVTKNFKKEKKRWKAVVPPS